MAERLQKLIAQAGIASRRAAEELIKAGDVAVNGEIVTELGTKADPEKDHIKVKGKLINAAIANRSNVYVLLNKPKGYLSSAADPEGRKLVTDLVKGRGRLHPVGRLDYNTEGLIILTNDGDFTNYVASSKAIPKVYEVKVKGMPTPVAINKLRRGVLLEDGFKTAPADIRELNHTDKNGWYEVTLHEGHNQQIRKMFDTIGHSVVKLKRIAIGSISDPYLKVGESRLLTPQEVADVGSATPIKRKGPTTKPPRGFNASRSAASSRNDQQSSRTSKPKRDARPSGKGPGRP
jgi:23S rRNA pseudouridine2605 synthase